jgi:hypothetical protein
MPQISSKKKFAGGRIVSLLANQHRAAARCLMHFRFDENAHFRVSESF